MDDAFKVLSTTNLTKRLNDLTFTDYYYRLMLLARTMFKWNNLPEGIDEKHIEKWLYLDGKVMFFKDKTNGLMIARCNDSGQINYYDEPTMLTPYGNQYYGTPLENDKECVLIRNNDDMIPTYMTIKLFALRLTNIERGIETNINALKTPILIRMNSDKQKLSLKNVYKQYEGNEPVIYADKDLTGEPMEVLKTDAPIIFDKLQIQKHAVWNEAMTFMGINNANMDKRERLVDDEVRANNEQVEMSYQIMLKAREMACEKINKLFGTNISVELRKRENVILEDSEPGSELPSDSEVVSA